MPYDKKLHFLAGLCITCIVIITCYFNFGVVNLRFGLGCGMVAGVAKEVKDEITYGGFDYVDMLVTWLGAIAGAGLVYMIR